MRVKTDKITLLKSFLAVVLMLGLISTQAQARAYLYKMPDGSRMISDKPLTNSKAKLIRKAKDTSNMGHFAANRSVKTKRRMRLWSYLIYHQSKKHGIDASLVKAVIYAESYFNPDATSHKGASGLMQLMPATAAKYGVSDRYNPRQNIIGGIKHLRYLMTLYPDNIKHVLAAYNAGENAVKKYNGIPPYRETQGYVKKVMKHFKRYQLASR